MLRERPKRRGKTASLRSTLRLSRSEYRCVIHPSENVSIGGRGTTRPPCRWSPGLARGPSGPGLSPERPGIPTPERSRAGGRPARVRACGTSARDIQKHNSIENGDYSVHPP